MLGIVGGTFDPIHYGHIKPVEETAGAVGLGEVVYLPSANPPLRRPPDCSFEHRLAMVELALADKSGFYVDDRDRHAKGVSYTVPILRKMRQEIGEPPLCLVMGQDTFTHLQDWHEWRQLPEFAHIIVMFRPPGSSEIPRSLRDWAHDRMAETSEDLVAQPSGLIWFQPVTPVDISASRIRSALAKGEPVDGLLPDNVLTYIRRHRLYH